MKTFKDCEAHLQRCLVMPNCKTDYNVIKPIYSVFRPNPYPDSCTRVPEFSIFYQYFHDSDKNFLFNQAGDFVPSYPTKKHVEMSWRRFDKLPTYSFRGDEDFQLSRNAMIDILSPALLGSKLVHLNDVVSEFQVDASAGFKFSLSGMKKKKDVLKSYNVNDLISPALCGTKPIWSLAGKLEWLPREKYEQRLKMRTFIIPPVDLLACQQMFFADQNSRLKQFSWSYYGFNPYNGGADALGKLLEKKKFKFEWDGVDWDRLLPHMKEVYDMRTHFLPELDREMFFLMEWTVENTVGSFIYLPHGDVVYKWFGNNSGSGDTTVDNILAMWQVVVLWHIKMFRFLYKRAPTKPELLLFLKETLCSFFGDDVVGGSDIQIEIEDAQCLLMETFSLFGIRLDPVLFTLDVCDLSFLGFKFFKLGSDYVPLYDMSRLCLAFYKQYEGIDDNANLSKLYSLMLMAAPQSEVFECFQRCINQVCVNFPKLMWAEKILSEGLPTRVEVLDWMLGRESGLSISWIFKKNLIEVNLLQGGLGGIKTSCMATKESVADVMKSVKRSERILQMIGDREGLTPEGMRWLLPAADPFHDRPVDGCGFPDGVRTQSVVRRIQKQITVTKPGPLAVGAWDCNVVMYPIVGDVGLTQSFFYDDNVMVHANPGDGVHVFGGITIYPLSGGTNCSPSLGLANLALTANDLSPSSKFRIIGMGYEVHNTTAPLYQSGAVTCYEVPNTDRYDSATYYLNDSAVAPSFFGVASGPHLGSIPKNVADATIIPSSLTWEAKEGCMVVATMNSPENFISRRHSSFFVLEQTNPLGVVEYYTPPFAYSISIPAQTMSSTDTYPVSPFNTKGSYFTGLSEQTVLTIKAVFIVEEFPAFNNVLITLAKPSPGYDPEAYKMYSAIMREMPVACEVKYNALGDWFRMAADAAGSFFGFPGVGSGIQKLLEWDPMGGAPNPTYAESRRNANNARKQQQKNQTKKSNPNNKMPPLPKVPGLSNGPRRQRGPKKKNPNNNNSPGGRAHGTPAKG